MAFRVSLFFHVCRSTVWRMLLINANKTRWQATFSKSLLVVFVMQILLSAACISSANAEPIHTTAHVTAHCHNEAMADDMGHMSDSQHEMSACSHCDIPDMVFSTPSANSLDISAVLLAVISLPDAVLSSPAYVAHIKQRAPPHTSSLLHHTNQRILI